MWRKPVFSCTCKEAVVDSMVVTTDLLTKSTMVVVRKKVATVSEENTMMTHTALEGNGNRVLFFVSLALIKFES